MTRIIELNIEIDTDEKILYIGEEYSSGVKNHYENVKDILNYIHEYLEEYHRENFANNRNEEFDDNELFE